MSLKHCLQLASYVALRSEYTACLNRLVRPNFKTVTYSHNTIKYQGSKLWNNLSNDLKKEMNSLSSFKCEIQKRSGPVDQSDHYLQCSLACM